VTAVTKLLRQLTRIVFMLRGAVCCLSILLLVAGVQVQAQAPQRGGDLPGSCGESTVTRGEALARIAALSVVGWLRFARRLLV
jgi:hypothetical protein